MAGLNRARRRRSQTEDRLKKAGVAANAGFNSAIESYSGVSDQYKPYMDEGKTAASALDQLFKNPQGYLEDPAVKARLKTSLDAVQNSAAAKGGLFGGNTLLAIMEKGGEFASNELDKAAARYSAGANLGVNATAAYDKSKENLSDLMVGRGEAASHMNENLSQTSMYEAEWSADMFSGWFGGSGPFGQATGKSMGK